MGLSLLIIAAGQHLETIASSYPRICFALVLTSRAANEREQHDNRMSR